MLVLIDESTKSASIVGQEKQDSILCKCDEFKEELEGWLKYKERVSNDSRYSAMSTQEFQHALVMLDELVTMIKTRITDAEKLELDKLIRGLA